MMIKKNNYRPLTDHLTIKESDIEGLGLFCTDEIEAGVCLGITHVLNDQYGVIRTPLGGFINHSDTPNCFILQNDDTRLLYTVRKIKQEELTVFYRF